MVLLRSVLLSAVAAFVVACVPHTAPVTRKNGLWNSADSARRADALHLLNRLTYGPRPGDVDRVLAEGSERFVDALLDAEKAARESLAVVGNYEVMESPDELMLAYEDYQHHQQRAGEVRTLRTRGVLCAPDNGVGLEGLENSISGIASDVEASRLQQLDRRVNQLVTQYQQVTVMRAALSEHQLYEIMVDFWTNHFNVFIGKANDRFLIRSYIEEKIRPFALGKFQDLLIATATSPAMLTYLDNAQSVSATAKRPRPATAPKPLLPSDGRCRLAPPPPPPPPAPREPGAPPPRPAIGLNENYGRELLELHTLGVDGGYTQRDVYNVARMFTGWSVTPASEAAAFQFNDWAHDRNEKLILGHRFSAGHGMDEGLELLRLLARHPATIRHISTKLCARFVRDNPPADCVETASRAWKKSDGDIGEVLRAVFHSPAFWDPANRGAKVKTPLQFVVSAIRALGAEPDTTMAMAQLVARLGEPLFGQIAPTGYSESQEAWMNSGALLARMNVAIAMAQGTQPGLRVSLERVAPVSPADSLVAAVNRNVLNGSARVETLRVLNTEATTVPPGANTRAMLVGLALGSPEFERR
jgi:uncharacterized protein (DUF1800 family)